MVHAGKVAGPAEDAQLACQQTLNKVRDDINQLIVSLNDCQSKIKDAGQFRVKPDDAKEQLESAQVLYVV